MCYVRSGALAKVAEKHCKSLQIKHEDASLIQNIWNVQRVAKKQTKTTLPPQEQKKQKKNRTQSALQTSTHWTSSFMGAALASDLHVQRGAVIVWRLRSRLCQSAEKKDQDCIGTNTNRHSVHEGPEIRIRPSDCTARYKQAPKLQLSSYIWLLELWTGLWLG